MTAFATLGKVLMNIRQKYCRRKTARIGVNMTFTAFFQCGYVINLLRGCVTRCMAGRAIVVDAAVDKSRAHKAVRRMTNRTIPIVVGLRIINRQVIKRQPHGPGPIIIPIMAGGTIIGDTHMVKNRWNEFNSRVTNDTILGGRQVIGGLASAAQIRVVDIVMARNTVTNLAGMIIDATGKGTRGVANITIVWSWRHVVERHTLRDSTIVTGIAPEIRDSRGGVVDKRR